MNRADVWPVHYAIEADPGRCTASFPIYRTEDEARDSAATLQRMRPDLPPVRVLRREIGPWIALDEMPADDEPDLLGLLGDAP